MRLKELRKEKGVTQEYLAEKLGVKKQNYGKIERGEYDIKLSQLQTLAEYFDCSIDYILGNTDYKKANARIVGEYLGIDYNSVMNIARINKLKNNEKLMDSLNLLLGDENNLIDFLACFGEYINPSIDDIFQFNEKSGAPETVKGLIPEFKDFPHLQLESAINLKTKDNKFICISKDVLLDSYRKHGLEQSIENYKK